MNSGLAPWLAVAGLGAFHGLNPTMGWLFAVALGLHRKSRAVVFASLAPIALGHAAAVAVVIVPVIAFGFFVEHTIVNKLAGIALIAWAAWHFLYGHRQRVRIGMQTGLAGLFVWSALMATAHGAGLMLLPVVLPLCLAETPGAGLVAGGSLSIAVGALTVHTAAMLAVIAAVSAIVYGWVGLGFLRKGWINVDLAWSAALAACGVALLVW